MRYLVRVAAVLAVLVVLPMSASAQAGEEGAISEPNLQEPAPSADEATRLSFWHDDALKTALFSSSGYGLDYSMNTKETKPASEQALQLGVDSTGLQVTPTAPLFAEELKLKEMDRRVKQSRNGLIGSAVVVGAGAAIVAGSVVANKNWQPSGDSLFELNFAPDAGIGIGAGVMLGGVVGLIVAGARMTHRKDQRRKFQETQHGTAHRVQWDRDTSRLVF
ncbi:MAG: hypothetical protein WCF10_02090 [Polyangiales bacterium]